MKPNKKRDGRGNPVPVRVWWTPDPWPSLAAYARWMGFDLATTHALRQRVKRFPRRDRQEAR